VGTWWGWECKEEKEMMTMRASEKLLFSLLLFLARCCGGDGKCVWESGKGREGICALTKVYDLGERVM
jgi:hypothetical protein